jgi:hypothetical protein
MRAQSLNTCKRVGVRVTSHSYWKHGDEYNQFGKECESNLLGKREEICMGSYRVLQACFWHEQQVESRGKEHWSWSKKAGRIYGACWSVLDHFGRTEEPGCQA